MSFITVMLYKSLFAFGEKMEKEFDYNTLNAQEVNNNLLLYILKRNQDTEYGKLHKFSNIKTIEEYRKRVPLSEYKDFEQYIYRETKGENNILTKDKIVYFGHSSGTTGSQKILPVTKESRNIALKLNGILCQKFVYNCFKEDWTNNKGVMLVDMVQGDKNKNKVNITSATSGGMNKIKGISEFMWTSPNEVLEIEDKDTAYYLHSLFALKEKKVMYIGGLFISSVLDFFRYIEKNYKDLTYDIKEGKINKNINIDNKTRKILEKKLGRSEKRSTELSNEFSKGFDGIAKRIWPNLIYIASVTGANFTNYNDIVDKYTDNIPICSIAYAATEGFIGINPYSDKIEYILIPNSCFFEFIEASDINSTNPKTYLMNELKINTKYEVIITNLSGLYRYNLGDIIKVIGFYNNCPKVTFQYRTKQLLNMVAEKTTEDHVNTALKNIADKYNFNILDYTTYGDNSITPGRYIIYLEIENYHSKKGISYLESALDLELQKTNLAYARFRKKNRLTKLKLKIVRRGTFTKFKNTLIEKSVSSNQIKIPRVIYDKEVIENLL